MGPLNWYALTCVGAALLFARVEPHAKSHFFWEAVGCLLLGALWPVVVLGYLAVRVVKWLHAHLRRPFHLRITLASGRVLSFPVWEYNITRLSGDRAVETQWKYASRRRCILCRGDQVAAVQVRRAVLPRWGKKR